MQKPLEPEEFLKSLANDIREFRTDILPKRLRADEGMDSFDAYDEAYNEWLESLHWTVEDYLVQTGRIEPQ